MKKKTQHTLSRATLKPGNKLKKKIISATSVAAPQTEIQLEPRLEPCESSKPQIDTSHVNRTKLFVYDFDTDQIVHQDIFLVQPTNFHVNICMALVNAILAKPNYLKPTAFTQICEINNQMVAGFLVAKQNANFSESPVYVEALCQSVANAFGVEIKIYDYEKVKQPPKKPNDVLEKTSYLPKQYSPNGGTIPKQTIHIIKYFAEIGDAYLTFEPVQKPVIELLELPIHKTSEILEATRLLQLKHIPPLNDDSPNPNLRALQTSTGNIWISNKFSLEYESKQAHGVHFLGKDKPIDHISTCVQALKNLVTAQQNKKIYGATLVLYGIPNKELATFIKSIKNDTSYKSIEIYMATPPYYPNPDGTLQLTEYMLWPLYFCLKPSNFRTKIAPHNQYANIVGWDNIPIKLKLSPKLCVKPFDPFEALESKSFWRSVHKQIMLDRQVGNSFTMMPIERLSQQLLDMHAKSRIESIYDVKRMTAYDNRLSASSFPYSLLEREANTHYFVLNATLNSFVRLVCTHPDLNQEEIAKKIATILVKCNDQNIETIWEAHNNVAWQAASHEFDKPELNTGHIQNKINKNKKKIRALSKKVAAIVEKPNKNEKDNEKISELKDAIENFKQKNKNLGAQKAKIRELQQKIKSELDKTNRYGLNKDQAKAYSNFKSIVIKAMHTLREEQKQSTTARPDISIAQAVEALKNMTFFHDISLNDINDLADKVMRLKDKESLSNFLENLTPKQTNIKEFVEKANNQTLILPFCHINQELPDSLSFLFIVTTNLKILVTSLGTSDNGITKSVETMAGPAKILACGLLVFEKNGDAWKVTNLRNLMSQKFYKRQFSTKANPDGTTTEVPWSVENEKERIELAWEIIEKRINNTLIPQAPPTGSYMPPYST